MTRRFSKRLTLFGICLSIVTFAAECQSAPIRSGLVRRGRATASQLATSRLQANRSFRQLLRGYPGGALTPRSLSGFRGASGISAALANPASATDIAATSYPNLQDVWAALAPTMRFASQLQPDPYTGLLPETPFVADLYNRRWVNQARFDSYHPQIAQLLDWDTSIRDVIVPQQVNPAKVPSNTNPQVIVPEPTSLMIGLGMVGYVVWRRSKSRPSVR